MPRSVKQAVLGIMRGLGILALVLVLARGGQAQEHPFIIVREAEYAGLQALCHPTTGRQPFIGWKTAARARSNLVFNESGSIRSRSLDYARIMDGLALSYILDPANRDSYRDKFYAALKYWSPGQTGNIVTALDAGSWDASIPPEGAFFATIVCMDIMFNDPHTTPAQAAQRAGFNALMQPMADFTYSPSFAHHFHSHAAARGIWELWVGGLVGNARLDAAVSLYKDAWLGMITEDGVFRETGGYAMARAGDPSRYQKGVFNDVIAYGIDTGWYGHAKMRAFYEWMSGYALAPNRHCWPIGDSSYTSFAATYNSAFVRAGNFSGEAAGYGEYFQNGQARPCDLFAYLCMARGPASVAARQPASRIFPDGGAYFIEKDGGPKALAGVLSNFRFATPTVESFGHMHKESNAINLAAFGEIVLRGPGYNGYGAAASDLVNFGFDFRYINSAAVSGNVAMFDYDINRSPGTQQNPSWVNEHPNRLGGSGVSGLIGGSLDYASGDSGALADSHRSIANGRHTRHFVTLYPQDGVNGYFLTMDELEGNATASVGDLVWHPYSAEITFNADNSRDDRYEWKIRQKANTADQLYFSIFMPTAATSTTQYEGLFADDIQGWSAASYTSFVGRYIFSRYALPVSKKRNVLTMHFPRKSTQAVPAMERIATTGPGSPTQAAVFAFAGGVRDFAMESDGASERGIRSDVHDAAGAAARGRMAVYRKEGGALAFYFVAKGRSFKDVPAGFTRGFASDADVDVYMKHGTGVITSPGAAVRFHEPGVTGVKLDHHLVATLASGPSWVEVQVPSGSHAVELVSAVGAVPVITSPLSQSGMVGAALSYQIVATNSPTSYAATGLPAGLSIDAGSGAITGTPTAAGVSPVTITATNALGMASETLVLSIAAAGTPQASITASLPSASEAGPVHGRFTVTLSPAPAAPVTVAYAVAAASTATAGDDYAALGGSVVVGTGGSADIPVTVLADSLFEGPQTVTLDLLPGSGYQVAGAQTATVSIADDDALQVSGLVLHPDPPHAGQAVTAQVLSNAEDSATLQVQWTWGDGGSEAGGASASHTYAGAGGAVLAVSVSSTLGGGSIAYQTAVTVASAGGGGGGSGSLAAGGGASGGGCGLGGGLAGLGLALLALLGLRGWHRC